MARLTWQKSSFSGGGEGNCVELAASAASRLHLRESDRPDEMTAVSPRALASLLRALKDGGLSAAP